MSEITAFKDVQKVRQNGAEACRAWLVRRSGLLVDAMDRAYNASVCRPEFPHLGRQARGTGCNTSWRGGGWAAGI